MEFPGSVATVIARRLKSCATQVNMSERLITLETQAEKDDELALVYVENGKGEPPHKRVSFYSLSFSARGEPNLNYRRDTELRRAEYEGMMSMWELARGGYKYIFWLSPPREGVYPEGRMVVAKVVKNSEGIEMECRGVPVLESADKMLAMANDLLDRGGVIVDGIRDPEDLREQAIGLNLEGELWDFCEGIFGMPLVWQKIRNGDDIKKKAELEDIVVRARTQVEGVVGGRFDRSNSVMAGALFEVFMARMGYFISGGNHGGTNMAMMGSSAFDSIYKERGLIKVDDKGNRLTYCEMCGRWYSGERCPYCSKN